MRTFTWVPQYTFETSQGHRVLISEMESGKEYRYYKGRKPREWTLGFAGNAQTIKEIEDFFNSMKGPFSSFRWTPPNEYRSVVVRFKEQTLDGTGMGLNYKSLNLTLREVL